MTHDERMARIDEIERIGAVSPAKIAKMRAYECIDCGKPSLADKGVCQECLDRHLTIVPFLLPSLLDVEPGAPVVDIEWLPFQQKFLDRLNSPIRQIILKEHRE